MKTTTSLCFSSEGVINPEVLTQLADKNIATVILFSDGSPEAFQHMLDFQTDQLLAHGVNVAIGKVPLYELRVVNYDGDTSLPHYVDSDDLRIKWICSKICPDFIKVSLSEITAESTKVELDRQQSEAIFYMAYKLWIILLEAERRLVFPAVVLDRMTRYTYLLTPQTIDIDQLRSDTGLQTLDYHTSSDMLSVTVAGELFEVKLSILNLLYGDLILPWFNMLRGRRLCLSVSVVGKSGQVSDPVNMTYGDLGRLVESMRSRARERLICQDSVIDKSDLVPFAKRVVINEESCLWPDQGQTIRHLLETNKANIVRSNPNANNTADQPSAEGLSESSE